MGLNDQDRDYIHTTARLVVEEAREKFRSDVVEIIKDHTERCDLRQENGRYRLGIKAVALLLLGGAAGGQVPDLAKKAIGLFRGE
jgi:hypothetical protein